MTLANTSGQQDDLEAVRERFEKWRQNRDKRGTIPGSLLRAAASLYPEYSLHFIAKALRINHTRLKSCVQAPSAEPPMAVAEHFINLGIATPACPRIVDMQHANGNRMCVQGMDSQELMNLTRLFFRLP
jgi:hypothetical protein